MVRAAARCLKHREQPDQAVGNHEQVTSLAMVRAAVTATNSSDSITLATVQRMSPPLLVCLAAYHTRWLQPQSIAEGPIAIEFL